MSQLQGEKNQIYLSIYIYMMTPLNIEPSKCRYIRLISFQSKVCNFSALPVPLLAGLSFQKQRLSCESPWKWTGKEGGERRGVEVV